MSDEIDRLADQATKGIVSIERAEDSELIEELQNRGFRVNVEAREGEGESRIEADFDEHDKIRFAVVSDTHLCSRYQQLTALRHFAEEAADADAQFVLHCGDIVEGTHKMHRDAVLYQFEHGFDAQVSYAVEHLPKIDVDWHIINGNHDYSFVNDAGANVARGIAEARRDVVFAGDLGSYVHIGPLTAYIWHPAGGVAYARSYKLQKWIEQQPPSARPDLVFGGHFHVYNHLGQYGGVEGFLTPCFQSQTPYIRRLGLNPVIAGLILEVGLRSDGSIGRVDFSKREYEPIDDDY